MSQLNQEPCFLGIDAGTTSLKAALYTADGRLLAQGQEEYSLLTPGPGIVEMAAEVYWQACCRAVAAALAAGGIRPQQVAALAVASQGETLIPVDAQGRPLRRAIVWLDSRAVAEAAHIAERFDRETVYHVTGQVAVVPTWPACKIAWLRDHEPDVFGRSAIYLLFADYLLYRLTGQYVTDYSLTVSSLLLDIQAKRWWQPMLDCVGLGAGQLPRLVEPGQALGQLSREGAEATGLRQDTVAVAGGLDQVVGALGAGNATPGLVTEMTGGALAIVATLDRPRFDPGRRVPCHYHARPDTYCLLPWGQTAGMALRWFRDLFFAAEMAAAPGANLYDEMTARAARVAPGCDGMVMLPHLEGAACPENNPSARAVFYGATLSHTRDHFTRAILEAVAYMLRRNLELVEGLGASIAEVRSIGGGAASPLWLQIKADVLQKPVRTVASKEVACLGAAMLAATGAGRFADLDEANRVMVQLGGIVEPTPAHAGIYQAAYEQYCELYERLAPTFRPGIGATHE